MFDVVLDFWQYYGVDKIRRYIHTIAKEAGTHTHTHTHTHTCSHTHTVVTVTTHLLQYVYCRREVGTRVEHTAAC